MADISKAAAALTDALQAIAKAERAITLALGAIGTGAPAPITQSEVGARTTSTQVLSVLSAAGGPLTLLEIADGVLAIRRGEDEPKKGGGTRYQEMCRTALTRLIDRDLVERVPPASASDRMRFRRRPLAAP